MEILSLLLVSTLLGSVILEIFFRTHSSKKSIKSNLYPSKRLKEDVVNLLVAVGKMGWEVIRLTIILAQAVLWVVLWPVSLWFGNRVLTRYK